LTQEIGQYKLFLVITQIPISQWYSTIQTIGWNPGYAITS